MSAVTSDRVSKVSLSPLDTVPGLILVHTAFGPPFAIVPLRNALIGLPEDGLGSARIDGASEIASSRSSCRSTCP